MDLMKAIGVVNCDIDAETGKRLSFKEIYERAVDCVGLEDIAKFIPVPIGKVKEAMQEDPHLNNISLAIWDNAYPAISFLYGLYGISVTLSQSVCILKEAAKRLAIENSYAANGGYRSPVRGH